MLTLAATAVSAAGRHLALVKSEPANSATLIRAPKAITLWFNQKPNLKLTRLVLIQGTRDTVKMGRVASADSTGKSVRVPITGVLRSGKYQVSWRTLSRDGHAVAGKFSFTVDSTARGVTRATSKAR